ncbi:hypothetical protein ACSNOK_29680 [Streptomyces sp. URMC 126]|uniref:hypothetical protein n=1 Tax=Streptomyces sp. URMC 126 TaxID=3423401 RepID=UPI003F198874
MHDITHHRAQGLADPVVQRAEILLLRMAHAQRTPSQGEQQFGAVARAGEHDQPPDPGEFAASAVVQHAHQIALGDQPALAVGDQEQLVERAGFRDQVFLEAVRDRFDRRKDPQRIDRKQPGRILERQRFDEPEPPGPRRSARATAPTPSART